MIAVLVLCALGWSADLVDAAVSVSEAPWSELVPGALASLSLTDADRLQTRNAVFCAEVVEARPDRVVLRVPEAKGLALAGVGPEWARGWSVCASSATELASALPEGGWAVQLSASPALLEQLQPGDHLDGVVFLARKGSRGAEANTAIDGATYLGSGGIAVTPATAERVHHSLAAEGARVVWTVHPGEGERLVGRIPPGRRLLLAPGSVGPFVADGGLVDVVAAWEGRPVRVLEAVNVLALPSALGVVLSPTDVEKWVLAQGLGNAELVLRHPDDTRVGSDATTRAAARAGEGTDRIGKGMRGLVVRVAEGVPVEVGGQLSLRSLGSGEEILEPAEVLALHGSGSARLAVLHITPSEALAVVRGRSGGIRPVATAVR